MRKPFSLAAVLRLLVALTVVVGSAVLFSSTDEPAYTQNDKAFYADSSLVNFVRPGLVLKVASAGIAADGTITARVTVTDPKGLPLDKDGVNTPGTVSISLIAAVIPQGQTQYTAYTTRRSVSANGNGVVEIQAGTDSGGTWTKNADGDYTYTFKTKAPAGYDRNATHTIAIYGARNLSEFGMDGINNYSDDAFNFVPAGGPVTVVRDIIRTESCNKCHDPLAAHGETGRRSVQVCVVCHTPQTKNPATGNTADFPVMIHKIHMGSELPSVKAGKPYQFITSHGTADFSTVGFPAGVSNCLECHDQNSAAVQKTNVFKPTRAACGACHETVNFATGENHANLPQVSDNQCSTCHQPQGEMDFDISILGAHVNPTQSRALPGTVFDIMAVDNAAPGKAPIVTFILKDKAGNPINPADMGSLSLVVAGPTSEYTSYKSYDVRKATGAGDGRYYWTLDTLPANATGSMSVGIEGYRNVTLYPGTKVAQTVRDAGINKVKSFSVDGSPVVQRRQVVSIDKCNKCHSFLSPHGGNRNQIEQCVLCHNPNGTDSPYRTAADGPANAIDLKHLIHKIHTGENIEAPSYVIVGYHGSKNDFKEVRYPGDRRDCATCHVNGSENLPSGATAQVVDPAGYLSPMGPNTSACTGCHTGIATASHALSNTTAQLGEACAACHGTNNQFSVAKSHAR